MSDKSIFGVAEQGVYSTDAPTPHIVLGDSVVEGPIVVQLCSGALATGDKATFSIAKNSDNWAVYSHATFTTGTPNTIDLSAALLRSSKGALANSDVVSVIGLSPGIAGIGAFYGCQTAAWSTTGTNAWTVLPIDTIVIDTGGMWDSANSYVRPKVPGYYYASVQVKSTVSGNIEPGIYKNGAISSKVGVRDSKTSAHGGALVYCNGTTDYIQPAAYIYAIQALDVASADYNAFRVIGPLAT